MALSEYRTMSFTTVECASCGVLFALPDAIEQKARANSERWFYCPNGHKQHYTKTEKEMREEEVAKRQSVEQRAERLVVSIRGLQEELEHERRSHAHTKGELTKARKKIGRLVSRLRNGVCTECNRSFENLRSHMETKHSGKEA